MRQPGPLTRLGHVLVHSDTSFLESCVVFAMAMRVHYLVGAGALAVREAYPLFTHYVPPAAWLVVLTVSMLLVAYGLASPVPPTITRRRFRAAGLALASVYYASFSLALALGPGGSGEAALTWALGSFTLLAAARLFGLVAGEKDSVQMYDALPACDGVEITAPPMLSSARRAILLHA